MRTYYYLLFAFAIISLNACQKGQDKAGLANDIAILEDSVFTENREGFRPMQEANARLLVEKYEAFAKSKVEASQAIDALFKAVSVAQYNRSYAKAAQLLEQIYSKYPDTDAAVRARFDEAYLYDDKIKNIEKARTLYEALIKDYPNSDYRVLAEQSLSVLGKNLEDILKEAKEKAVNAVE